MYVYLLDGYNFQPVVLVLNVDRIFYILHIQVADSDINRPIFDTYI